jgi:hypothetical protein
VNANLLTITKNHWDLWKEYLTNPRLACVRDATANITKHPVTEWELMFVTGVILHTSSVYYVLSDKLFVEYDGLRRDIEHFFSLPIPKAVWGKIKQFQNDDFIKYIESIVK